MDTFVQLATRSSTSANHTRGTRHSNDDPSMVSTVCSALKRAARTFGGCPCANAGLPVITAAAASTNTILTRFMDAPLVGSLHCQRRAMGADPYGTTTSRNCAVWHAFSFDPAAFTNRVFTD